MTRRAVTTLIGLLTLCACGGAQAGTEQTTLAPAVEATTTVTPTYAPEFTIAFAGDVHFERGLAGLLDDPDTALDPIAPYLRDADLTILNLETAITTRGAPEPKTYTFRTPPEALAALAAGGVDVVSLANNHGVDYGREGLEDTLAAQADSPVAMIGIGEDEAVAFAPHEATIEGVDVAVIAASQLYDRTTQAWSAGASSAGVASAVDADRLLAAVSEARENSDLVIVYLHWGTERVACPTDKQLTLAGQLAEAGADAILGSHAHTLLGSGWTDSGTYVNYGLGNFIWYHGSSEASATTGVLTLTIRDGAVAAHSWAPAKIPAGGGVPIPREGEAAASAVERWHDLRDCTDLAGEPPG